MNERASAHALEGQNTRRLMAYKTRLKSVAGAPGGVVV
jgi:hypothetical protein